MLFTSLFLEPRNGDTATNKSVRKSVSFLVAILILSIVLFVSFAALSYQWNWEAAFRYRLKFLEGWFTTLKISSVSFIFAFAIGFLSTLCSRSRFLPLKYLASLYVELIRGTPLLVQIFLFYYVIADAANVQNAMWLAWR